MSYQDYTQKVLDDEAARKLEQADWITRFRQTAVYGQLLEEFESESVERNLESLALQRSQINNSGPWLVKEELAKKASLVPFALRFFRAVQVKKQFDLEVRWNAGKLDLPGIRSSGDFSYMRESAWSRANLPDVDQNDLAFIRSLLSDDEYLVYTTAVEENYFRPEDQVTGWYSSWDPCKPLAGDYPVLFRKYDVWNHQEWLPELPPTRLQAIRKLEKEKLAAEWTDPEEGRVHMPWEQTLAWTRKWFQEKESLEMQRWFEACDQIRDRKVASYSIEFLKAVEFLLDQPVRPYPDGTLRWDLAIVAAARKILFANVTGCLDMAFETYMEGLKNKSYPLYRLEGDM